MSVFESFPLSPLQRGLLYHLLKAPHSGRDIEQIASVFREPLDVDAMRSAWEIITARHAALRTTFTWQGLDEPRQDVHAEAPPRIEVRDWRALGDDERAHRLQAFLREDRERGFAADVEPPTRVTILLEDEAAARVVWTYHHIVMDGLSMRFVLRELYRAYDALARGDQVELPPVPPGFRQFVEWRQALDTSGSAPYWRELLAGFSGAPMLPVAHPADSGSGSEQGNTGKILLDAATTARLHAIAMDHRVTMTIVAQAAWAVLLGRYVSDDDVTFGVVRRGRPVALRELERSIGLFITNVPMRVRVDPTDRLAALLARVRDQWVALQQHEQTSLPEIATMAGVPGHVPLFDTILVFDASSLHQSLVDEEPRWASRGLELHEQPGYLVSAKCYDGERLSLELDYDATRLDAATARAMLGHFRTLLEGIAERPDAALGALPLCTAEERALIVEQFSASAGPHVDGRVHELVETQAYRTPDALAVVASDAQLTYAELDARASALAAQLRALGVGPDVCVGVCLERSPAMIVAVLAVLKAGGAYVPLDPAYPAERVAYMLENARAPVVLTQRSLRSNVPATGARIIEVDEPLPELTTTGELPGPVVISQDALAYVIYTSGSTGKPKGVAMPHRALVNLLAWQKQRTRVGPGDRTLQFSSLSFDVSFQEIFATLGEGGTLVLVSETLRRDAPRLLDYLREQRIARLFLPFIALQQLAQVAEEATALPETLREVITAGEQLQSTPQVVRFFERLGDCVLDNQYGPTESHVVTSFLLAGRPDRWPSLPPIGRPITNARIYLLSPGGQPVPVGVPGELFIAGICLAHGYLHRPELTTERFVPDPFVGGEARMYRTGDLARWLPGGDIEYLGRVDHQVKVRGYRVELGEIEAALATYPGVREGAVMARESHGGKQLVAWYVPAADAAPTPSQLREFLTRTLPEHMVPAAYVALERMPLTPSGKVDRRSLPAPDERALPASGTGAADGRPRDTTELRLVLLWERLLGIQGIGRDDDFFALGGHSLLAVALLGMIQKTFGRNLPLVTLFEAPTIARLAERVRTSEEDADATEFRSLVSLQPGGRRPPLFMLPGGGGILLAYRDLVPKLPADLPVYGLQPPALAGLAPHFDDVRELAAHYIAELRRVQPHGPYYLHGWCIGGVIAYEMAQQLLAAGDAIGFLLLIDTTFPRERPGFLERLAYHFRVAARGGVMGAAHHIGDEIRRRTARARGAGEPHDADAALRSQRTHDEPDVARREKIEASVLTAEWRIGYAYRPAPIDARLTLYWPSIKPEEAYVDSPSAWERLALRGATHRTIEGNHHDMFLEPRVRGLAAAIAEDLAAAHAGSQPSSAQQVSTNRAMATI